VDWYHDRLLRVYWTRGGDDRELLIREEFVFMNYGDAAELLGTTIDALLKAEERPCVQPPARRWSPRGQNAVYSRASATLVAAAARQLALLRQVMSRNHREMKHRSRRRRSE
jgi:hypothetical protein